MLKIWIRKLVLWSLQEILIETRSLGKSRLQSKQLLDIAPGSLRASSLPGSLRASSLPRILWMLRYVIFHCPFRGQSVCSSHYRLGMQDTADYLPSLPSLGSATRATQKTTQFAISSQMLLHTEELMRRAAIYSSITDSFMTSQLEYIPNENKTKIVQEQVKIMAKASRKGVSSAVAAASNLQLIRRDVALGNLRLKDDHVARARTAPYHGKNLLRPNIKEFDAKIFAMREQRSLHRGLTKHFKVPKKPAPKAAGTSRLSVPQRLGPPCSQLEEGRQSFWNGQ